jgi:hypothetical protein
MVRTLAVPADWRDAIRRRDRAQAVHLPGHGRGAGRVDHVHSQAANSARNWDYRYCWLRDSYFVIQTPIASAPPTPWRLSHFIDHIIAASNADSLQPLYGISEIRVPRRGSSPAFPLCGMGPAL